MIKIIRVFIAFILLLVISLIVIFGFNPFNLRTKLVTKAINSYLDKSIPNNNTSDSINNASSTSKEQHPLLNQEQVEKLQDLGINIKKLPQSITPGMKKCFIEKLGQKRANEIVKGNTPSTIEFFKAKECLKK